MLIFHCIEILKYIIFQYRKLLLFVIKVIKFDNHTTKKYLNGLWFFLLMLSTLKLLEKLREKPLFTLNQLSLITRYKKSYLKVLVNRLAKKKIIFRLEKGKFTVHEDPLIFSSHIIQPSYLTLWTALSFYGLTAQLPLEIYVASMKKKKPISFNKIKINFIKLELWGFQKKNYQGIEIFIAEKEKLLIDIISTNIVALSEIDELIKEIDKKRMIEYSLRTKNKSLIKRIGFLLEKYDINTEKLINLIDNNYILLTKKGKRKGKKNKKWKIIDNR